MDSVLDLLFLRTWWSFDPDDRTLHSIVYRTFNLLEAGGWAVFAVLVFRRYLQHRRSLLEPCYALAFLAFGMTDLREAITLQSWLLWIKLANLLLLLRLRTAVIRGHYPESRMF